MIICKTSCYISQQCAILAHYLLLYRRYRCLRNPIVCYYTNWSTEGSSTQTSYCIYTFKIYAIFFLNPKTSEVKKQTKSAIHFKFYKKISEKSENHDFSHFRIFIFVNPNVGWPTLSLVTASRDVNAAKWGNFGNANSQLVL